MAENGKKGVNVNEMLQMAGAVALGLTVYTLINQYLLSRLEA